MGAATKSLLEITFFVRARPEKKYTNNITFKGLSDLFMLKPAGYCGFFYERDIYIIKGRGFFKD